MVAINLPKHPRYLVPDPPVFTDWVWPLAANAASVPDVLFVYVVADRLLGINIRALPDDSLLAACKALVAVYPTRTIVTVRWFPVPTWWPRTAAFLRPRGIRVGIPEELEAWWNATIEPASGKEPGGHNAKR